MNKNLKIGLWAGGIGLLLLSIYKGVDYGLSLIQEGYIKELHPKYQNKFREFIAAVTKLGYSVTITSGYRSFAKQAALKKENASNATAGLSHHNYGLAIDLNIEKGGKAYRKATSKQEWLTTGVPQLAKKMGFIWGAEFGGYHDPVHFAIPLDTKVLLAKAQKQFGTSPDKIQGNNVIV